MKICFVGPANSSHIEKWCKWFTEHGHEVHVISFTKGIIPNTNVHLIDLNVKKENSDFKKLKYIFAVNEVKKLINSIKPDVISVHYASSYGFVLALTGINDYFLSIWGSDVYVFPKKSIFHKLLVKYSLKKARYLLSTSKVMAKEASKYTNKKFFITPFGVDLKLFNPEKRTRNDDKFVIGTVKSMEDNYGIDKIIKALAIILKQLPTIKIELRLAGDGPDLEKYIQLSKQLCLDKHISFLGRIDQASASHEWANMDIAVIPSEYESFGVAAIEAQASGIPVIISQAEGLLETTIPNKTSLLLDDTRPETISKSVIYLYNQNDKRMDMGNKARIFVEKQFEIDRCFLKIERMFYEVSKKHIKR